MKSITFSICLSLSFFFLSAQIGIGTETPNSEAALDVVSSDKGVLLPRLPLNSTTVSTPFTSHIEGMLLYNTSTINDVTPGFYYNDGSKWLKIGGTPTGVWNLDGNNGIDDTNEFIGTTDNKALKFRTNNTDRMAIDGDGSLTMKKGILLDCDDCGSANIIDGTSNYGDLVLQGRYLSGSGNIILSPPANSDVIINNNYRAAGGSSSGTSDLEVQEGGIKMKKRYRYFQRYEYDNNSPLETNRSYVLGSWYICALTHVGFQNTASNIDEDDDIGCMVYPSNESGIGTSGIADYEKYFTDQYNSKPTWTMYFRAYADTNRITCAAICLNLDGQ